MKGLLRESGDRGALAQAPDLARQVLALTRRGKVRLGPTPAGIPHYVRNAHPGWMLKIELWSEMCLEDGVLVESGELLIDRIAGSFEGRLYEYDDEAQARLDLPHTDPDGPPQGGELHWTGWWALAPRKDAYEAVSFQLWRVPWRLGQLAIDFDRVTEGLAISDAARGAGIEERWLTTHSRIFGLQGEPYTSVVTLAERAPQAVRHRWEAYLWRRYREQERSR